MEIEFKQTDLIRAYSSHGCFATFEEIVSIESEERENEPFIYFRDDDMMAYKEYPAIWVTREPINAFRYVIGASERDETDKTLMKAYPDWREDIVEIACSSLYELVGSDDGDDGILLVEVK